MRIVRRADGYYVQFCIDAKVRNKLEPTEKLVGLDVGIKYFLADSRGNTIENPKFYRKSERALNRLNRKKSRKYDKTKNHSQKCCRKACFDMQGKHLKVSRQPS